MSRPILNISPDSQVLSRALADDLVEIIHSTLTVHPRFALALSGGSTPAVFFSHLASLPDGRIAWERIDLYWCDERCVPPDDPQSNYGMTRRTLLEPASIPLENIHRIRGEDDPAIEALRYGREIKKHLREDEEGWPVFDGLLLGLGEDGHTASLFPGSPVLQEEKAICAAAVHPATGQRRITLTLPMINHAANIYFLVSGAGKAAAVAQTLVDRAPSTSWPAGLIRPRFGRLAWFMDKTATALL